MARQDRASCGSGGVFLALASQAGIERWGQHAAGLGGLLGKHPDVVSRWARKGAQRRSKEVEFSDALNQLDGLLAKAPSTRGEDLESRIVGIV